MTGLNIFAVVLMALLSSAIKGQIFIDQSSEWGVDAIVESHTLGSGISTFDFNYDGFDDITLANDGQIFFYLNQDGNSFSLIDLGINIENGRVKHVLWVDYDNDEDADILISVYNGKTYLFENNGDLSFENISLQSGLPQQVAPNYGISCADYDKDGLLDIFLCRYDFLVNPPDNPDTLPQYWSRLFKNNGDGTFSDVTAESGSLFTPTLAFQSVWMDVENDNWQDNFIIVDRFPGNHLFQNGPNGFNEITDEYQISLAENDFMSNSVADYDNDGYLDIFMTNTGSIQNDLHTRLLKNNGGLNFSDVSESVGLAQFAYSWGATWGDFNNDGLKDLFFVTPEESTNHLHMNGGESFYAAHENIESESDYPCYAVARGDFNNDGFYDLAVQSRAPNPPMLLINQSSGKHWVKVGLEGSISNRAATGASIRSYAAGELFFEYLFTGENYISQNSQYNIIGLGSNQMVDSLIITYPSGHHDSFYNLAADTTYHFIEGETYYVEIESTDTVACHGETIQLDAGNAHISYNWNTGDTTQTITVDSTGIYSVETSNEFGIIASNQISVEFVPNPQINELIAQNPCEGDSLANIELVNLNGIPIDSVFWNNESGSTLHDSLPAGIYNYLAIDINNCSSEGEIEILDPPEFLIFPSVIPANSGFDGQIILNIFGGVQPYTIIFQNDTVSNTIAGLAPGEYLITVIDFQECEITISVIVETNLSLIDYNEARIELYPNPAMNLVYITQSNDIASLKLFSLDGVETTQYSFDEGVLDISELDAGIYIARINLKSEKVPVSRRLIKSE